MTNGTEWWSVNQTTSFSPNAILTVLLTGIPIVTLIANLPAILTVISITVRKENVKNLHICSVGITDAFVGVFAYLMGETYIHTDMQFSFFNCCFRYYMYSVTFVASMLHVLGICVQRLKILTSKPQPQQNQRIIEWVVIVTSWLTSAVINTIAFVLWTTDRYDMVVCSIDALVLGHELHFFYFIGSIYAIIISLVTAAMGILLRLIWIKRRILPGNAWGLKNVKLCATIGIIGILFVVSTTPLTCVLLNYEYLGENKRTQRAMWVLFSLLNSLINPFVYLFRIKEFRENFKNIFRCRKFNTVTSAPIRINVATLRNSTISQNIQNEENNM